MKAGFVAVGFASLILCAGVLRADAPAGQVGRIHVQPDQAPDCSSLKAIVESVTRDCKTNDQKAIAIYNFMSLAHFHAPYAKEKGGIPAIKEINCYGWGLCGGLHSVESSLWRQLGWKWRFRGWNNPGHTTVEAEYDGRWHYVDIFLKFYAWMPDGKGGQTIAGEDDLRKNAKDLLTDVQVTMKDGVVYQKSDPYAIVNGKANWTARDFLDCGDTLASLPKPSDAGSPESWGAYNHADGNYSADVNLVSGLILTNTWDMSPDAYVWAGQPKTKNKKTGEVLFPYPLHGCPNHKDMRHNPGPGLVLEPYFDAYKARCFANGMLTFVANLSDANVLKSFAASDNVKLEGNALVAAEAGKPASVVVRLASPYILTKASGQAAGADKVEVSVDDGKTYKAADLKDFSAAVKGSLSALVKVTFSGKLSELNIEGIVQNNPSALPYLSPGKNKVTISVADPKALGDNKLVVTYAYRLGSRSLSFDQLVEQQKNIAGQVGASWSPTVTYVQQSFAARDLPATMEVDCPTPKGKYPVYPRMMFLRREVVAPGGVTMALPEGAAQAKAGPDDELPGLPNPFDLDIDPPKLQAAAAPAALAPAGEAK